ncbi:hypothetical protein EVAR_33924_1 [Eumeta japonica]|uniref:Uncharacterized protein n=1 Tax=Eumeta variegata TaxID=151549 RepID=A0A4C1VVY4_EUMVA|nr:hypothetical protein EVAR_33924_1 [Eumeta japonica]
MVKAEGDRQLLCNPGRRREAWSRDTSPRGGNPCRPTCIPTPPPPPEANRKAHFERKKKPCASKFAVELSESVKRGDGSDI